MFALCIVLLTTTVVAVFATVRRCGVAKDTQAVLVIAGLTLGFYWRLLIGDAYSPAGGGDLASFLYPYYAFAASALHSGFLPFWNPNVFSGAPFVGDIQAGLFYPINLLQFLASTTLTYHDMQALSILHVFVAGAATYVCLRTLPTAHIARGPSLVGAIAFMFSDIFVVHFGNLNMIAVVAWLPLVFTLFANATHRGSFSLSACSGALLGLSTLAGHIQPTLYNALLLSFYALWEVLRQPSLDVTLRQKLRPLTLLAVAIGIAIVISAPATLPAYLLSAHTPRASFTYWDASRYSLSPLRTIGLILPDFFGRDPAVHWGVGDRVESGYIGLLPLASACMAALTLIRRNRWVKFYSLVAVASLVFAVGDATPLHGWLFALVPGLDMLRAPARAIYLTDFALAALAALGLQRLTYEPLSPDTRNSLLSLGKAVARCGFLAWVGLFSVSMLAVLQMQDRDPVLFMRSWNAAASLSRAALFSLPTLLLLRHCLKPRVHGQNQRLWLTAVASVVYLDLASVGAYIDLSPRDPTFGFHHDAAVAFLQSDPNPFRVDVDAQATAVWQPNLGCLYGISHVRGVSNPMVLERYSRYLQLAGDRASALYDLLGAKYLVMAKAHKPELPQFAPVFNGDDTVDIYLNTEASPLAMLFHRCRFVESRDAAESLLLSPDYEPKQELIIEGSGPEPSPATGNESLSFTKYEANAVEVMASTTAPSYLMISVPYAPGWQASLDGQPAPILVADLAFCALFLPAGQHTVSLRYSPPGFVPAACVSLVCLVGLALWSGIAIRRRWRRARPV